MKVVAFITQPDVVVRILNHVGEPVEPPPVAPAREVQLRLLSFGGGRGPPVR